MKTVTFETAKRLYDLGIKFVGSERYWGSVSKELYYAEGFDSTLFYYAPDAQELYPRLKPIIVNGHKFICHTRFDGDNYWVEYYMINPTARLEGAWKFDCSFSEALAEMLIWLIENKYVTVEQINKGE